MPDGPDLPPLSPQAAALLDPARLLHARCGRPVADHPYGTTGICPFPDAPPPARPRGPAPDVVLTDDPLVDRYAHPDRDQLVRSPVVPWRPTDPAPLPASYLEAVDRYLTGDTRTAAEQRPPTEPAPWACARCRSPRRVSVSFDRGYTRRAQCVPCGYVAPAPLP